VKACTCRLGSHVQSRLHTIPLVRFSLPGVLTIRNHSACVVFTRAVGQSVASVVLGVRSSKPDPYICSWRIFIVRSKIMRYQTLLLIEWSFSLRLSFYCCHSQAAHQVFVCESCHSSWSDVLREGEKLLTNADISEACYLIPTSYSVTVSVLEICRYTVPELVFVPELHTGISRYITRPEETYRVLVRHIPCVRRSRFLQGL
jgi:hypothetical protein